MNNIASSKELLNKMIEYKNYLESNVIDIEGNLSIDNTRTYPVYYHNVLGMKRKYIENKNIHIAKMLAQKSYNRKILKKINKAILAMKKFEKNFNIKEIDDTYSKLSSQRKDLIIPAPFTWEQMLKDWNSIKYEGLKYKSNEANIQTSKGEYVRSKSERLIADTLYQMNIPYRYEYPVRLNNGNIYYPDFFILSKKTRNPIIVEHFGMMNNPEYAEKAVRKIINNQHNGFIQGYNILYTFETSDQPLNTSTLIELFEEYI